MMGQVERLNPEGIPRQDLKWVLTQERLVREARKIDSCLMCKADRINEAALCQVCWALLDDDELRSAQRWTMGVAP